MVKAQDVARRGMVSKRLVGQIVVVAALGSGMKGNAMWHVPHHYYMRPREYIYIVFLLVGPRVTDTDVRFG